MTLVLKKVKIAKFAKLFWLLKIDFESTPS